MKTQSGFDPLQVFIDLFPDGVEAASTREKLEDLPLEDRLRRHIIDGEKQGLTGCLDEAMGNYPPLDIINDHLLDGMKTVGELFGSGEMQLPFVLQSAETMKAAVAHLEPHLEKVEGQTKGSIVLATVKGDVHDIGKNLVDIILSNNGYTVHNIGIKQPIADILSAWRETGADAIGMSGLLVKSVNVMEDNLKIMVEEGLDVPVLLGGAALSRHYCDSYLREVYKEGGGRVYHGKDAFEGLRIMDRMKEGRLGELDTEIDERLTKRAEAEKKHAAVRERSAAKQAAAAGDDADDGGGVATLEAPASTRTVEPAPNIPEPPFWGSRVVQDVPLRTIYAFINRVALYRGQWLFKKAKMSDAEYAAFIEDEVDPIFERLAERCANERILEPALVYGYFPAAAEGDTLIVYDPDDHTVERERFTFPRQTKSKRLCITDFFVEADSGKRDVIAMHCVTMGSRASDAARELFEADNYQEYLYLHGFGVECAEGLAEFWHKHIRQELGIGGDDATRTKDLFTQTYRGSRYSFGYPACPDMSHQEKLWRLLEPGRIGCELTENWQIDPEQSTSAIIVHHPQAKYFSV